MTWWKPWTWFSSSTSGFTCHLDGGDWETIDPGNDIEFSGLHIPSQVPTQKHRENFIHEITGELECFDCGYNSDLEDVDFVNYCPRCSSNQVRYKITEAHTAQSTFEFYQENEQ